MIALSKEKAVCSMILPSTLQELSQCCLHKVGTLCVSWHSGAHKSRVTAMTQGLSDAPPSLGRTSVRHQCQTEDLGLVIYHSEPQHHQMEILLLASLYM